MKKSIDLLTDSFGHSSTNQMYSSGTNKVKYFTNK